MYIFEVDLIYRSHKVQRFNYARNMWEENVYHHRNMKAKIYQLNDINFTLEYDYQLWNIYGRENIQKSISSPIMNTEKQQSRKQYQPLPITSYLSASCNSIGYKRVYRYYVCVVQMG